MIGCSKQHTYNMRYCNSNKTNRSAKSGNTACKDTRTGKYYTLANLTFNPYCRHNFLPATMHSAFSMKTNSAKRRLKQDKKNIKLTSVRFPRLPIVHIT